MNNNISYIGPDGKDYVTPEGLQAAKAEHLRRMFPEIIDIFLQPEPLPRIAIFLDK